MRALDPEVVDAVWTALGPLLPQRPPDGHPLGTHRPRIADRVCFEAILIRLVTGCAWVDVERLVDNKVSDTTLRGRRDEWLAAGVFDTLFTEERAGTQRIQASPAGSGRCSPTATASPLGGPPTAHTAMTLRCSSPRSPKWSSGV